MTVLEFKIQRKQVGEKCSFFYLGYFRKEVYCYALMASGRAGLEQCCSNFNVLVNPLGTLVNADSGSVGLGKVLE